MRAAMLHCRGVAFICLNAAPALILFKKNSIIIIEKINKERSDSYETIYYK